MVAPIALVGFTALSVEIITNLADAVGQGHLRQPRRADEVVFDGLAGLAFHHGHVLVRGGVKQDGRTVLPQDGLHLRLIQNVGDQRNNRPPETEADQFLLDGEQLHLGLFHQQQPLRAKGGNLPAQLAADAAARARDHDPPVHQDFPDVLGFNFHGLASEEVLNFHRPDLGDFQLPGGELIHGRNRRNVEPARSQQLHDFADAFRPERSAWR